MCERVCMYVCMGVIYIYVFMPRHEDNIGGLLYHSLSYALETGFLTEPGAELVVSKPQILPKPIPGFLCKFWGFGLSPGLCSKYSFQRRHHPNQEINFLMY